MSRHLLFLAHRIPYPPNKGDKIRSFHELRYLAEKGWKVHLCALADDSEDLRHVFTLKEHCATVFVEPISPGLQKLASLRGPVVGRPLSAPYFYKRALQRRVDRVLGRYPVRSVLCFSGPMAEYVFNSRQLSVGGSGWTDGAESRPRLVMDLVDVDSDKWAQYAPRQKRPLSWIYRVESWLLARYEKRVAEAFDATVLVSPAEAETFRRRTALDGKIYAVGNGVDLEYFHPKSPGVPAFQRPGLVFCGAMDYFPNVDAVTWFAREVLPRVRVEIGEVGFTVVGSNPTDEVLALRSFPGVRVTGRVDDVRPFVWEADVSLAPIRVARGIQNKVLEAMAMGKPIVTTEEAFEGIEAVRGSDLVVAPGNPQEFTEALLQLLKDREKRRTIGESARIRAERSYRWDAQLQRLETLAAGTRDDRSCDAVCKPSGLPAL